ncbi:MAG: oligosaccharide flippase family protein, partial [Candidatus Omnitrophota bacterium]
MPRSISPNANKASLVKSLFANSAALLGIRLFMPISFFAISILVARLMGVRAFGAFAIIFSYYALFRILSNFGIDSFLMREIPRDESRARLYLDHSLFAGTAFSLIGIVLMNTVLAMAGYSPEIRRAGFFASLALWPDCLNKYAESFFTGMQKSWIALGTVLAKESLKIVLAVG